MARNSAYLDRLELRPHVLRDTSTVTTRTTFLGQDFALPVGLGPTGFTRMMHHEGEIGVARAAAAAGVPYALSTMGTTSLEDLRRAAPDAALWFQLYLWRDLDLSMQLVRKAHDLGYRTLVLTVDTPVAGDRRRDVRNGMTIPPALSLRTLAGAALRPAWWFDLLTTDPLEFASMNRFDGTVGELVGSLFDPGVTLDDLSRIRDAWSGTLLVKGVQRVDDAVAIVERGVDGIVLSNHGGRQLDRSPVPLALLPEVVREVRGRASIAIDGGFRSGADVVAAYCLGADFVLLGRAYLYGLMAGGEEGVARVLEIIGTQVTSTLHLLGARAMEDLTVDYVVAH